MEYNKQLKNRLKRVEGQINGILRMIEEGKDCREVVMQLSAARSALDKTIAVVVSENLEACIRAQMEKGEGTEELIQEAVNMLVKSR
ncbi:metal-sensitive transcriptional regulator [Desulfuribacillus alkaliarsenatis]|uniref:Cytoplasmic protein n=1 Tax=Desulfuribacillus alkaliarsenatis TaxID=766136 RepID=A0A1E5G265_9FIRM|nr:metal-sensitive transcriptional regulator [Desulfuribacillus alkaliarsenatis]OEF96993.1 cytoplasmic protein [Desulfuribacillus alkaliarsenatis]